MATEVRRGKSPADYLLHLPSAHNFTKEKRPHRWASDDTFPVVVDRLDQLDASIAGFASTLDRKRFSNLYSTLERELKQRPQTPPTRIAVLGHQGNGKSTLINNVVDCPDLLETAAMSRNCTNVPTLVRKAYPDQTEGESIVAILRFRSAQDVATLIREHVETYQSPHLPKEEASSREDNNEAQRNSKTALEVLQGLTCNDPVLKDPAKLIAFLLPSTSKSTDDIVTTLCSCCSTILESLPTSDESGQRIMRISASSLKELRGALAPYIRSFKKPQSPQLWPFLEIVELGLRNRKFLEHIELIDLPGCNDTNYVRRRLSDELLRKCDMVWIVNKVERAATDVNFAQLVEKILSEKRDNITLVLTHAELNADDDLVETMRQDGYDTRVVDDVLENRDGLREQVEYQDEQAEDESNSESMRANARKWAAVSRAQLDKVSKEVTVEIMKLRVQDAMTSMQDKFKHLINDDDGLDILCVSNKLYRSMCSSTREWDHADATGVPLLRKTALGTPAGLLERATWTRVLQLKSCFSTLKFATENTGPKVIARLKEAYVSPTKAMTVAVDEYYQALHAAFEEHIVGLFLDNRRRYIDGALRASRGWSRNPWTWMSYKSFAKHRGNHYTQTVGSHNWCRELVASLIEDQQHAWSELTIRQNTLKEQCRERLTRILNDVLENLHINGFHTTDPIVKAFTDFVANECERIAEELDEDWRRGDLLNRDLRARMISDGSASYIIDALDSTFEDIADQTGDGTRKRQIATMEDRLIKPDGYLIDYIRSAAQRDFSQMSAEARKELDNFIQGVGDRMDDNHHNLLRDGHRVDLAKECPGLVPWLNDAIPLLDEVEGDIRGAKQKYRVEMLK